MKNQVTPWFPAEVKPFWIGHYQRKWTTAFERFIPDYWDGFNWYSVGPNGRDDTPSRYPLPWRGLAKKP